MSAPLVGVTGALVEARFGVWELESALVPAAYLRALEEEGARPLVVPPSPLGPDETLDALDGLVFTGGSDLDPRLYGEEPHPRTDEPVTARDEAELALMRRALERDVPVLAVCRGSQVLNVALGGTLVQHLPDVVGHERHRPVPGVFADHEVAVEPGTALAGAVGRTLAVKSHHHQGLGRLGEGLRVAARADDGTVEAVELPGRRLALGVLWHAEEGGDRRLFAALVAEARRRRDDRAAGRFR